MDPKNGAGPTVGGAAISSSWADDGTGFEDAEGFDDNDDPLALLEEMSKAAGDCWHFAL